MTETRSFGTGKRESHDSSKFYARFAKPVLSDDMTVNTAPAQALDMAFCQSSEHMAQLPDNSVALTVTSPPYHAGKDYDTEETFEDYLKLMERVFTECYRVTEPGGRIAVNVAGLGRKPYVALSTHIDLLMQNLGWLSRGHIIWVKGKGANGSIAVGTFRKAKNPVLRDLHEYILVYSKGRFGRVREGISTITKEEFLQYTLSVWEMAPESARRVNHPAPFPVELPRRLIKLYTYQNDLILDPFMGVGTTAVAAIEQDRHFIGYDNNPDYVERAIARAQVADERRLMAAEARLKVMPTPTGVA